MENALQINDMLSIPGYELWTTACYAGGPGGQHVNKTSTRITLHWQISASTVLSDFQRRRVIAALRNRISAEGILRVTVSDHRSQHRNRLVARDRMAQLIRDALVPEKKRHPTRVSLGAKRKRLEEKRRISRSKQLRKPPSFRDE